MRVLVYGDIGGSGGYHRYCKGLFGTGVIPEDVEVWFVCSQEFAMALGPLDPSVRVVSHAWPGNKSRLLRYCWHLWVYPGLVRQIRPDVEFFPSGHRRVYGRWTRSVTTCHNLLLYDQSEIARLTGTTAYTAFMRYRAVQSNSFKKSDATIFLSEYSRNVVSEQVPGIRRSNVIPHGLDATFLRAAPRSYELGQIVTLLYVSPIYHYKHQKQVVEAVRKLREISGRDLRLRLVGGGDSAAIADLKHWIAAHEANSFVSLRPFVAQGELVREYWEADISVFASSCETFGITLLEAMGARLPIACSYETGLPAILEDAGVYFDPRSVDSIIASLSTLLSDESTRKRVGERAYEYARKYTWRRCAAETFRVLRSVSSSAAANAS